MSYTLRGRVESRLAASVAPFVTACVLGLAVSAWWPVELAAAMVAAGLLLDALFYHRLVPYQPGWLAVPFGLVELALTMALVRLADVAAPLEPAVWFFAASWLVAQLLAHAGLPFLRLTYAEDGGELGRGGAVLSYGAVLALLGVVGVALVTQPPTVRLDAGVHEGPITIDHSMVLEGEPGTVVRGGIVIRADDVTVRDIHVVGGQYGIDVDDAQDVALERVDVSGASLDAIHVRRSEVIIRDCTVDADSGRHVQGIDISFSAHRAMSMVEGCTVLGGQEGIVTHSSMVEIHENTILDARLRGITMTEMSMGSIEDNEVRSARGVGIYCGDYSHCEIEDNVVAGTFADSSSDDPSRAGYAIQAHFHAQATVEGNRLLGNAHDLGAFAGGEVDDG
ncbi:MAG TPA: right-handed parallel beta-helix repeat-containing protein [Gaiellaceae bacterium]|nr:right-handed parallel beta-helix repeat-containing protein [Gaiellaceae bacterium]